jgi:serine/threonine-protein phosphatase 2B catalytic subunit
MSHAAHFKKAMELAQHKQPVPQIDFTVHQLDDGNTVSTQERVVKEVSWTSSRGLSTDQRLV